jgi:hypothetical protein
MLTSGYWRVYHSTFVQAFRQQFTVALCAPGILGCQQLHALVGRTNKLMRQHLAVYGCTGQLAGLLEQQQHQQQAQGKQLVRADSARFRVNMYAPLAAASTITVSPTCTSYVAAGPSSHLLSCNLHTSMHAALPWFFI